MNQDAKDTVCELPTLWSRLGNLLAGIGKRRRVIVAVIALSWIASAVVGLTAREPMVADEVVHYYMAVTQAGKLPAPNVEVDIPMRGWTYHRQYPHVFGWHYVAALVWLAAGKVFWAVQVYHSLFWLQLLVSTWFLARSDTDEWKKELLVVVTLASLPMAILFSVLLYQDVPATAHVVTAFAFLKYRRPWLATLFMALALATKVTVFTVLPMFLLGFFAYYGTKTPLWQTGVRVVCSMALVAVSCVPMALALKKAGFGYYPAKEAMEYVRRAGIGTRFFQSRIPDREPLRGESTMPVAANAGIQRPEIANHPGDLRLAANWLVYFGPVLYMFAGLCLLGSVVACLSFFRGARNGDVRWWPLLTGVWAAVLTAHHMRSAPDARFFLPAAPFLVVGVSGLVARIPFPRVWMPVFIVAAFLQTGAVLFKTYNLRHLAPSISETIRFLDHRFPDGANYLMYPEGHERFIRGSVDWYMNNELRDFWRSNNDRRIGMLQSRGLGAVVVKKNRIRDVKPETVDLGLYPLSFVNDVRADSRFELLFENKDVIVFKVPDKSGTVDTGAGKREDGSK